MDSFGEGAEAAEGADLLGLALGREPGATDLDDFVEFEVYYDGTAAAAEAGEAVPFLRARTCEAFELLDADLGRYLWQRDRFVLELDMGESLEDEPHLVGHLRTGDGAEDEWFVIYLLRRLTAARADVSCRVFDADGEVILIEAALVAPRWLSPTNAENRCWLRGGQVHLLPRPRPPEPSRLPRLEGLKRLRAAQGATAAKEKVQRAIERRLQGYPRSACELSSHVVRAVLPVPVARLLLAYPQLVSVAADHLPPPPTRELLRCRRELQGEEAGLHLDCEGPPVQETACVGVRFTRCQYARLVSLRCQLPQRFTQKHWRQPRGSAVDDKAMHLGALLCAGLEAAYLQGTSSATAALRWPNPKLKLEDLLPPVLPWMPDVAFACRFEQLESAPNPLSAAIRRAFVQQSKLDEPFRRALLQALGNPALTAGVELAEHWRDGDDPEDWLRVSGEELDREMQARQEEYEAYDRKRSSAKATGHSAGAGAKPEKLREEIAAMGQEISGLLARASSLDGLEPTTNEATGAGAAKAGASTAAAADAGAGSDSDSDGSGSGELDVLGMEEEGASSGEDSEGEEAGEGGSLREYMTELDEQLEGELDRELPGGAAGASEASGAGSLPLTSHHVRVHDVGPIELDVHAMEHVLASYCSEHQLAPGPASLLLGELGLMGGPGGAAPRAAAAAGGPLSAMD